MAKSLRKKTLHGAAWAFFEKIGTQGVHFLVTIVLARLLTPDDYGVVGMLAVFLSISQLFIDCGFGLALIRKKDRTEKDFSTVFWYNLIISLICYVILFSTAPFIALFYKMPILSGVLRVVGLNLVIHALYTIQVTRLTSLVQFGLQAKIAVSACAFSGAIGIALAYFGFGPWALVGQMMGLSMMSCILFWLFTGWRPRFVFSWKSFRCLFGFGSRIMLASSLHTIYTNMSPLIIGRKYTAADLGFYSRGDSLAALPGGVFQATLGRVIFPVLSSIQDDEKRLRGAYNKYLRLITSLVAPAMLILSACAEPLTVLLIGEKWLPCVPYLQLLSIAWMCNPITLVNLNILYVKGRSDVVLRLEIIKKVVAIVIVVLSVQFGVTWLCVGRVLNAFIAMALNIYWCGPFLGMGFWRQMLEVLPIYISSFVAAGIAYIVVSIAIRTGLSNVIGSVNLSSIVLLALAGGIGLVVYVFLAWRQKFDFIVEGKEMARKYLKRNR